MPLPLYGYLNLWYYSYDYLLFSILELCYYLVNINFFSCSVFRPIFDEGSDAILDQTNGSNSSIVFVNMRDPIITVNESNIYEG